MVETARKLAALRGVTEEAIAAATTANFERLCGW
jgi:Tat protein secretion system quality control protein TatD with DNase activity